MNKWSNKQNRNTLIDGEQLTAIGGGGGQAVKVLSKKEKGLLDKEDSVVIAGGGELMGLTDNRKNTIEIKLKNK